MIREYKETLIEQEIINLIHRKREEFERSIQPLLDQLEYIRHTQNEGFPIKYILDKSYIYIDWKPDQPLPINQ